MLDPVFLGLIKIFSRCVASCPGTCPVPLLPREVHQGSSGAHPGHGGALEHLARIWRIPK